MTKKPLLFPPNAMQDRMIAGLRISLGLIFFWFGALKVAGFNPVYDIVLASFPIFAEGAGNRALGVIEAGIGLGLLVSIFPRAVHLGLISHLLGTFAVFVTAPGLMFAPYFPVLTLQGEFVFKNAALAMAGLVVLAHRRTRPAPKGEAQK